MDEETGSPSRFAKALVLVLAVAALLVFGLRAGMTQGLWRKVEDRAKGRGERIPLRIWDWWSPSQTDAYTNYFAEMEREFEKRHPEVDVLFQYVPFNQYEQKMSTAMAGGTPPDVFQCSVTWTRGFYERGMLLPMNDYLERERLEREERKRQGLPIDTTQILDRDQFLEPAWRHNTTPDGVIFGMPQILDASCLVWNLDMLQVAAAENSEIRAMFQTFPDGSIDWSRIRWNAVPSWEAFRRITRALTRRDENGNLARNAMGTELQTGYYIQAYNTGASPFDPWLQANGGQFQDSEGTRADFAGPEGEEAVRFLIDLVWKDKVCPPFRRQIGDLEVFEQRRAACIVNGTWCGKYIVRDTEGWMHFGFTAYPPGPRGKQPTTLTWGNHLVISKRTAHPDIAWDYVKFVAGLQGQLRLLRFIEQNSPRKDFYNTPEWKGIIERLPYLGNQAPITISGGRWRNTQINAVNEQIKYTFETMLLHGPEIDAGNGPLPSISVGLKDAADRADRVFNRYQTQVAAWRAKRR